jgi:hypothetical protein
MAVGSLLIKMLLMHTFASLFMLLSQGNCREAFYGELCRRADRIKRCIHPRPPVRLIPIEPGDICPFCHDDLLMPLAASEELSGGGDGSSISDGSPAPTLPTTTPANPPQQPQQPQQPRQRALPLISLARDGAQLARGYATALALGVARRLLSLWGAARGRLAVFPRADKWCTMAERASAAALAACGLASSAVGSVGGADSETEPHPHVTYCRYGCGKPVHRACAEAWWRDSCVYCSAPMH